MGCIDVKHLGTLSAGLLAFDDGGRLLAVKPRGRRLLQGLDTAPGAAFEVLFGEPFGPLTARLLRNGEQRLRGVLGSAPVARCVGRPAAPSQARPALPGLAMRVKQVGRPAGTRAPQAAASGRVSTPP